MYFRIGRRVVQRANHEPRFTLNPESAGCGQARVPVKHSQLEFLIPRD